MRQPVGDAALISRLESIRDLADDLAMEVNRAQSDDWSSVRAMVAHIQREATLALELIDIAKRRHK